MPSLGQSIRSVFLPNYAGLEAQTQGRSNIQSAARNLSKYISPVQLQRMKQDIKTWREAKSEEENPWYPHRVKEQQIYLDTVLNGQVESCMKRRKDLTMLKKYHMVNKATRKPNPITTNLITNRWFKNWMSYALDKKAYGYSLIYLDDMINDAFPNLSIIRRFNISPERLNVTQYIYSLSGANFLEQPFADWHVWLTTPTENGINKIGCGYLYKVAFYEIVARNVLTQNLDATEQYGMPLRVGKTSKKAESEERLIFEQALAEMGSAGYMLMDAVGDEVELVESKSLGNAYKIYESLELRCEKKISKLILGHADAMDSVPGKIGGSQGGEISPAQQALDDTASVDMEDFTIDTNDILLPKLRKLGLLFPEDEEFEFDTTDEQSENRRTEDKDNLATAQVYQTIKNAGGDPDWDGFSKKTGIKTSKIAPIIPTVMPGAKQEDSNSPNKKPDPSNKKPLTDNVKAKLDRIYHVH